MARTELNSVGIYIDSSIKPINLLSSTARVETPFIKVTIGNYTFGVYDKAVGEGVDEQGVFKSHKIQFPNFVQQLDVKKINGQVNNYTLTLKYPITEASDPNFFEKVFSSVSQSRKIVFSYGDFSLPTFYYKNEQAIITDIKTSFSIQTSVITYTVSAVSSCAMVSAGAFSFVHKFAKPSDIIKEVLYNKKYGLQEIFYGMADQAQVEANSLILGDDKAVSISLKTNISILDYLSYLVSCMTPMSDTKENIYKQAIYSLVVIDDTTGTFNGPYFKIVKVEKSNSSDINKLATYEVDIGYPAANVVLSFDVENNENYSILYKYNQTLTNENYSQRINDNGELEQIYAPMITSSNPLHETTEADRTWWTSVTQYPIKASLQLKGLLRPAILMTYVKLNVWFFGRKHISSGLYIITQQTDSVSVSGFSTTLKLTRVSGDDNYIV